ncbi:ABC transporter substrate-binding protein [Caldimonas sp. KR1-144]|uniref:ABC transporter substrate-binding protein n=1 Tax=Caldimonas sp. KR1-144 TaxID=3400911 RepID=UPI003BFC46D9
MQRRLSLLAAASLAALACLPSAAFAQANEVVIGATLSASGPGASLGIPEKNTLEMLPKTLGGLPVRYVIYDDATDPALATKNARRLVDENKADAIIGSSTTPSTLAVTEVAFETKTPQLALSPLPPTIRQHQWVFPMPQPVPVMAGALLEHMKAKGVKTLGFIGYADAYGESWLKAVEAGVEAAGVKMVAVERYARTDTSVNAQVLKLTAATPDAVLIAGSGTPSALPQLTLRERGYKGQIYQTHGSANSDFLRVAGKSDEGLVLPTGPVLVAEQLPDSHPSKPVSLAYLKAYEAKFGPGSRNTFGAHAQDAYLVLDKAVAIAAAKARPGTPEFRAALRDAIEATKNLPVTHGVMNMTPADHNGFDARARVLITVKGDSWQLVK